MFSLSDLRIWLDVTNSMLAWVPMSSRMSTRMSTWMRYLPNAISSARLAATPVLLYAAIYTIILSVVLFYVVQLHLIGPRTLSASVTYPFIRPWGRVVIDEFGKLVPWFEGMFIRLEDFFGRFGSR